ncbi:type IV secretory system conjugative DNA transfer family protein [Hoeflea poritis]|uniref:Type IV secretion system DNA-binding domain-containing protein n=1 Tax=Hoeflea poritis TaxID=2993659 RepID=A0ABT4VKK8_9HYPH|nr:type IV secretion system DNA-binding domain-containing protein [Hoeflea poritis]MDA4845248.1 type IV secretion system DNA-binding domain-containing protein [Hoeflea poritis]
MKNHQEYITILGHKLGRQPHVSFGIRQPDRLFHQYIIGQTGTGKSTLLRNMMIQDAANSQGFCLIDPHGDLAEAVRANVDCETLYWHTADPDCPLGYNPLTYVSSEYRPLVASGLIDTLKKQWADAWGARMEHLLRYALLALLDRPQSTLQDIMPMFLNTSFRKQVVAEVHDGQVKHFWMSEFPKMNYKSAADGVAPIANKLGAFLAHPVIRKAVCEPTQPLRFRQIMDEGQTLIVNLAKGKLGSDVSNILGGLIVSSVAHGAYSRQDSQEQARQPFIFYVDEFHSFTTEALGIMLSELRKYRVGIVAATQFARQVSQEVHEAFLGNVGTILVFRVGATDAATFSKQFGHKIPTEPDLVNLPNHEMYIKLMIDGAQCKPFSATTYAHLTR